jgi:hypothetical protein
VRDEYKGIVIVEEMQEVIGSCRATGWILGVRIPAGQNNCIFFTASRPALESTQPPIQWVPEARSPGREADHSPPSTAEVRNGGAVPPLIHTSL